MNSLFWFNSLWPSDPIWWQIWVNTGSSNGLLPNSTKPLPEPMLTNHQWGLVTFTLQQLHKKYASYLSLKWVWNLQDFSHISKGPMSSVIFSPGPRFNIKMTSYQYRKSHGGDKTILRPSYLHNGISYTGKTTSLYWIGAQKGNIWQFSTRGK